MSTDDALRELSDAFVKAYDGSVLVTAVTTDVAHTRRAVRSIDEPNDSDAKQSAQQVSYYVERLKISTLSIAQFFSFN